MSDLWFYLGFLVFCAAAVIGATLFTYRAEHLVSAREDAEDAARDARLNLADAERRDAAGMAARDGLLADRLRERFVITLTSGESFDGLLEEVDERTVVLRNASALQAGGQAIPLDGELLLRRDTITYLQRP